MSDRIKKLGRELADQHMKGYAVGRREALADAKARIEDLHYGDDNLLIGTGYQLAVNDALAALTQPQTERCPEDCDGFGRLIGDSDGPCPACSGLESDGGGAATAAGAADADLEAAARRLARYSDRADDGIAYLTDTGIKDNAGALAETLEQLKDALPPGPYAKAFRERVCPVPEFPGIAPRRPKRTSAPGIRPEITATYGRPAPVPHTDGEKACPDCAGSGFIPAPEHEWHDYRPCPTCSGTGKGKA